jgi:hypothetical protein
MDLLRRPQRQLLGRRRPTEALPLKLPVPEVLDGDVLAAWRCWLRDGNLTGSMTLKMLPAAAQQPAQQPARQIDRWPIVEDQPGVIFRR